jgi:hypothetical protein
MCNFAAPHFPFTRSVLTVTGGELHHNYLHISTSLGRLRRIEADSSVQYSFCGATVISVAAVPDNHHSSRPRLVWESRSNSSLRPSKLRPGDTSLVRWLSWMICLASAHRNLLNSKNIMTRSHRGVPDCTQVRSGESFYAKCPSH